MAILTPPSGRGCTAAPRPGWMAQWAHRPHLFSAATIGPCHNQAFPDSPSLLGCGHRATYPMRSQQWPPRLIVLTLGILLQPNSKEHMLSPLHIPPIKGQEVAYLGPRQFGSHVVIVGLHCVCKLKVAQCVLVATEHLLEKGHSVCRALLQAEVGGAQDLALGPPSGPGQGMRVPRGSTALSRVWTPRTVCGGRVPRVSVRLWYICWAVPSKCQPQPATDSASPVGGG